MGQFLPETKMLQKGEMYIVGNNSPWMSNLFAYLQTEALMTFVLHYFFSIIYQKILRRQRVCLLPELVARLFAIQCNVSFWGKGQAGLLMAHYKRCCLRVYSISLGHPASPLWELRDKGNWHEHEDYSACCVMSNKIP